MTPMKLLTVSTLALGLSALVACGSPTSDPKTNTPTPVEQTTPDTQPVQVSLADIIADPRRSDDQARDMFRNPKETLEFFDLAPGKNVAEIWPGWYTKILAPYALNTDGTYTAVLFPDAASERSAERNAAFRDTYGNVETYGTVNYASFDGTDLVGLDDNSQDIILTFRNVHNWMGRGGAEPAFAEFYSALKPGGILGVVEHRLPESAVQDPTAKSGYVQESYMKALAKEAGFEFVGSSEINANPRDTADHPFGVWTLPPRSRLPEDDAADKDSFDAELYKNIGESDRATLKFRKPL